VVVAHEDAWKKAGVAHCDISPGNIQILDGRGVLGDWEYAIPIDQLGTRRAINSVGLFIVISIAIVLNILEGNNPNDAAASCTSQAVRHHPPVGGIIQDTMGRDLLNIFVFHPCIGG
jgi:hypothetical protein